MKARVGLDKKTQQRLKERAREEVRAEYDRQGMDLTRRHIKLWCVAMHEEFGFGKKRLLRAIEKYGDIAEERQEDEVFWAHIDIVLQQIGLDFPKEDYNSMDS